MGSRQEITARTRESGSRAAKRSSRAQSPRAASTREAVREIVSRYRETFERLRR